jgi:cytidine deaminase
MLGEARKAAKGAYCPYSNFHVGAAARARNSEGQVLVFLGANVENASYGLTICAERVAMFKAATAGYTELLGMSVSCTDATDDDPPRYKTPCGACRQVMQEFAVDDDIPVSIDGVGTFTLKELLPMGFKLK